MITPLKTIKNTSISVLLIALAFFSASAPAQALTGYQRAHFARNFAHTAQSDTSRQQGPQYGQKVGQENQRPQTAHDPRRQVSAASARSALARSQAQPKRSTWDIIGQTANKISTVADWAEYLNPHHTANKIIEYLVPKDARGILSLVNRFIPGIEDKSLGFISDTLIMNPVNMLVQTIDDSSSMPLKAFKKVMEFYSTPGRASVGEKIADYFHDTDAAKNANEKTKKYVGIGAIALDLTRLTAATYNLQKYYEHSDATQQVPFFRYLVPRVHEFAKTYQNFVQKYAQDSVILNKGSEIVEKIIPHLEAIQKMDPVANPWLHKLGLSKLGVIDLAIHLCRNGLSGMQDED